MEIALLLQSMIPDGSTTIGFDLIILKSVRSILLAIALLLAGQSTSHAASANPGARAFRATRAIAGGTIKDGPKHTIRAIRARPFRYGAMLLAIGSAGAAAHVAGVHVEPYAIGLSIATWAYQVKKSVPSIRKARGVCRLRAIGANIVWPFALLVGTTMAGNLVGRGEAPATATLDTAFAAGTQATVITADVPTIAQTAMAKK